MGIEVSESIEGAQCTRWAERFLAGDESIGDQLGQHVRKNLRRRFLAMGLSVQDADELAQDCTVLIFSKFREYDPARGNLETWLSGYARNAARSWWRSVYSRGAREAPMDVTQELHEAPDANLDGSPALEQALGRMNPVDQELLQMRFGFGYSFDEIAEMANLTVVNARKRVSRCVETLRKDPSLRREMGFSA